MSSSDGTPSARPTFRAIVPTAAPPDPTPQLVDDMPSAPTVELIGRHQVLFPRRKDADLREQPDDLDLSHLQDPVGELRDHAPPPERIYENFDACHKAVVAWAKDHGISYNKQKWSVGKRTRLMMVCSRWGKPGRGRDKESYKRRVTSQSTNCPMKFWLLAVDNNQPDGEWKVKWCQDKQSISHNHPPVENTAVFARYRRETRNEIIGTLHQLWADGHGAKEALVLAQEVYPDALFTRQDLMNEYRKWRADGGESAPARPAVHPSQSSSTSRKRPLGSNDEDDDDMRAQCSSQPCVHAQRLMELDGRRRAQTFQRYTMIEREILKNLRALRQAMGIPMNYVPPTQSTQQGTADPSIVGASTSAPQGHGAANGVPNAQISQQQVQSRRQQQQTDQQAMGQQHGQSMNGHQPEHQFRMQDSGHGGHAQSYSQPHGQDQNYGSGFGILMP